MKVLKFGGTSVGTPEALAQLRQIVQACPGEVIVVVSALSGVTDQLLRIAKLSSESQPAYREELDALISRHRMMLETVVPAEWMQPTRERIEALLTELSGILTGVSLIKDLSQKTLDAIVSYGERLSSVLVAALIPGAQLLDARDFIKTKPYYGKHIVDFVPTEALIRQQFATHGRVTVVPGFIASDALTGDPTNLGRGGSDYTASVLAATLGAEALELWTDVDGFMTADPKVIRGAYVIEHLTFVEAMELSNFGAKVIYPPTIFPAYHSNIPILIKNTFNPSAPGTYISRDKSTPDGRQIRGISSINDTCLVTVRGLGMVGVIGVNYRIFKALSKSGISVFFVSQAASENTTSIGVRNADADLAAEVLTEEFAQEIAMGEINPMKLDRNLATVAIVGENMKHVPGIAGKLFGTLGRNGINVIACAQGASQTNISFVVTLENLRKSINVIHDSFFLSEYQVLNIFLAGVGLVGHKLLEQICAQQEKLKAEKGLQLRVVGISNSRRYLVDREGIDLKNYCALLEASGQTASPGSFRDEILSMNIFNPVFVDCTASAEVESIYEELLEHNISVVTANKIAASAAYEHYEKLKNIARVRGVKFFFETNVGAGLPIIGTIADLINSGDRILRIEAVLSGTINFIFNEMSAEVPFSRAIQLSKEAGYAEPDPRIDLSGTDVIRKLVILSREAGYRVEQADVQRNLFIPESYFQGSVEEFWKRIPEVDAQFEQRRQQLEASGKRLRFVAVLDEGRTEVSLREVDAESPFYQLAGSNNVIMLTTERYKEYPMVIKGYGAGQDVTAAGVFADIISIANIR